MALKAHVHRVLLDGHGRAVGVRVRHRGVVRDVYASKEVSWAHTARFARSVSKDVAIRTNSFILLMFLHRFAFFFICLLLLKDVFSL